MMLIYGGFITVLVLAPNLIFLAFPPRPQPVNLAARPAPRWAEIAERIGQVGCFALPFLYFFDSQPLAAGLWLGLMAVALVVYYSGWARYLRRGRGSDLLYSPLLRLPIPLAVTPVLYFLLAAGLLASPWLALAALCLAAGHWTVSWAEYAKYRP